ncbi:MAG: O-antigen ligase family protein [Patescibacteria group bacterium]|nr:O-antigen ligase family protein [Patescibacteria group bacterium]
MENLLNRKTWRIILFIFLAELFSVFAFLLPSFERVAFLVIVALVLALSLIKLEYGILILLAELFIGSKGYLFYLDAGGITISIRIAFWLIVMAVWLGKFIANRVKTRQSPRLKPSEKNIYFYYFIILFLFIAWGMVNGFLNHNDFSNIFFDFNGWFYFALIFPIYDFINPIRNSSEGLSPVVKQQRIISNGARENIYDLGRVFLAATTWLALKTFFFLFAFSHDSSGVIFELYKWVRATGVGEITPVQGGFYRIFFQSHIFILIGFFILLTIFSYRPPKNNKFFIFYFLFFILSSAIILVSFSRSFWVGAVVGLLFYYLITILRKNWKFVLRISANLLAAGLAAAVFTLIIVKFPYPTPIGGFDPASLFSDRLSNMGEAAVSSRWQLLPPLWTAIKQNPVLGSGFGATVTYESKDPRILTSSPTGEYTTYAFEWGWLDIWLKLGFFGLLAYLWLIGKVIFDGFIIKNWLTIGLALGLIVIAVVSIFSPYTNHPLGIGYLLIAAAIITREKVASTLA